MPVPAALKKKLIALADKYEVSSFCDEDPSQFTKRYTDTCNIECASFLAAMFAFGSRKQFIPKINFILETADNSSGNFAEWIKSKAYRKDFPLGEKKFYRFYSYSDVQIFFDELNQILNSAGTLGDFFRNALVNAGKENIPGVPNNSGTTKHSDLQSLPHLADVIASAFPKSRIVPKGKNSANKRIHMFLRWMVRTDSPVDLGLWTWYSPALLLIPLDIHVMQEAIKLGLLPENAKATRKTAATLTSVLNEVFPGDPARGDFALFGLGVDAS